MRAAGTAAALSLKDGVTPRALDVQKLRKRLVEMGINLENDPKFGLGGVSTDIKIKPDDLIFPEKNASGQATTELRQDKRAEYVLDIREIEQENMQKYLQSRNDGYTDTGGDVGTNLE